MYFAHILYVTSEAYTDTLRVECHSLALQQRHPPHHHPLRRLQLLPPQFATQGLRGLPRRLESLGEEDPCTATAAAAAHVDAGSQDSRLRTEATEHRDERGERLQRGRWRHDVRE